MPDLAQAIWSASTTKPWLFGSPALMPTVLTQNPGEVNIVYVEGINLDGTPNANTPYKWNDVRFVLGWSNGAAVILGRWLATTEPGRFYSDAPLNPGGAAHVALGQFRAWKVGMHHAGKPNEQEALVQAGTLMITRDRTKEGKRSGPLEKAGSGCGINQHNGSGMVGEVGKASAGCLVGQSVDGHREFMALVKSDPRYLKDKNYLFHTAILPCAEVQRFMV